MRTFNILLGATLSLFLFTQPAVPAQQVLECFKSPYYYEVCWPPFTMTVAPPATMPWQGNTAATVGAQFPVIINWVFQTQTAAVLNTRMARFTDLALARFSHEYWVETHGNLSTVMYYAAAKLSAANLVRWRAAFGAAATDSEVGLYAPAAVRAAYTAAIKRAPIKQSHAAYVAAGKLSRTINAMPTGIPAPTIYMSPYEIYNEYLWTTAATETEALILTAKFMAGNLAWAATVGWKVGSDFYAFAEKIDPNYGYDLTTMYGDINLDFGVIEANVTASGELLQIIVLTEWCIGMGFPCGG